MWKKPDLTVRRIRDEILKSRGVITIAARNLGCSRSTIYKYIKKHPALQKVVSDMREEIVDIAESKLFDAVEHGEHWAVSLTLKTMGKNRGYNERQEITGKDGEEIKIRHFKAEIRDGHTVVTESEPETDSVFEE